jgi:RNA polymerase sigma-70 factor, ECF subfamily
MRNDANQAEFAALYARAHVDLLRYVLTLLPDRHQAEDVVQDTARLLWRKFEEYDPAQPFLPWARKFAYFEVLKFRRTRALREKYFSDELLELLAEERAAEEGQLVRGREALDGCLQKLDEVSRQLLKDRYGDEIPLEELARRQGKKVNALYVVMHRIRQRLLECVNRTMKAEGWT